MARQQRGFKVRKLACTGVLIVSGLVSSCGAATAGDSGPLPARSAVPPTLQLPPLWTPTLPQVHATTAPNERPSIPASPTPQGLIPATAPRTEESFSSPQAITLDTIQMQSATEGWGRGTLLSENAPRVLRTVDGGATWADVMPPGVALEPRVDREVVSLTPDVAWVFVAVYPQDRNGPDPLVVTVYQTVDGGRQWRPGTPFEIEHGIADLPMFIDPFHGWILPWTGEEGGREHRELWRTIDGGITWELLSTTEDDDGVPLGCSKNGLAFADERVGWMTGVCPGPFFLYTTADGGATWFPRQSLPVPEGLTEDAFNHNIEIASFNPVFFPDGAGYLAVELETVDGRYYHLFYATQDGGITWAPHLLPVRASVGPDFITPEQGWVSDGRQLFETINGGTDWDLVGALPARSDVYLIHIDFVDSQHGWLLDRNTLSSTEDGGHTWRDLTPRLATTR